jgi:protoporphyrinogen IX oxidase
MIITIIMGVSMLTIRTGLLNQDWMLLKLVFVIGLILYHLSLHVFFKKLQNNISMSSTFYRYWNEVATLFLVAIVFLAITKNVNNWWQGLLGLICFSLILILAIKIYKKIRDKNHG